MTTDRFIESIQEELLELPAIKFATGITSFVDVAPDEEERIAYRRRIIVNAIVRPYVKLFLSAVSPYKMSVEEYNALFLKNISIWMEDSFNDSVI